MKQKNAAAKLKARQALPLFQEQVKQQKQKAEALEVAGRHKGDGQKDHKGAR
jgi:stress response protein YsnF